VKQWGLCEYDCFLRIGCLPACLPAYGVGAVFLDQFSRIGDSGKYSGSISLTFILVPSQGMPVDFLIFDMREFTIGIMHVKLVCVHFFH
jgi:hypothetical protein